MRSVKARACWLSLLLGAATACTPSAEVEAVLRLGENPVSVEVKALDVNAYRSVYQGHTDASGRFRCRLKLQPGQPEFYYFYAGGKPFASLVLTGRESVRLEADSLGNVAIQGSEPSVLLQEEEQARQEFFRQMAQAPDIEAQSALYLAYYRDRVRFLMEHPGSLACVPILFEKWENGTPMLAQLTDAIHYRNVCDSLKRHYPASKYIRALEKEATRREREMAVRARLSLAAQTRCPALELPDMEGKTVSVLDLTDKVVLIHFWNSADVAQKMFNLEVLLPLYEEFHARGLEIYAVAVNPDKVGWAGTVRSQELPWINVNDGLGAASPAVMAYQLQALPASFLLTADGLSVPDIKGLDALRKELNKHL